MRVRSFVLVAAAVLLIGGGTALAQEPVLYVSNPDLGQIWSIASTGAGWAEPVLLFEGKKLHVGDLVVGPDDWLYACAPDDQLVFRFDPSIVTPGDPLTPKDNEVEVLYDGSTAGPVAPQCGWFSDRGDLFLTDQMGDTAVWIYRNLVPLYPGAPSLDPFIAAGTPIDENFFGQGLTQAAPGDLLFVDNAAATVWSLGFDPIFRFDDPDNPGVLKQPMVVALGALESPVGIARIANDDIFVTDGSDLHCFTDSPATLTFSGFTAEFLASTSDDRLFVATTSRNQADLWEVDATTCTKVGADPILTFAKPAINKPAMAGVAVSRTSRDGGSPDPISGYYYFNFKDHAYEVTLENLTCSEGPTVTASENPPECLEDLITYCLNVDNNDEGDPVTGVPVTYAGDDGVAQLYSVNGSCTPADPAEPVVGIGHAISAYTDLVKNPRIVRCELPDGFDVCTDPATECSDTNKPCQLINVESFFPFDGAFPNDGRIAGTTRSSDFSEFFFADITLSGEGDIFDNSPGCFCGWESPLPNIFRLEDNPFDGLPVYNAGSAVPLKFRVAATDGSPCGTVDYCAMPDYGYVTGARVLLSVAQIYSGSSTDYARVFVPVDPAQTSGSDANEFGNPTSPSTPYHYNLDTSTFQPGIYQAVALALTDNFAVEWTYFAVR